MKITLNIPSTDNESVITNDCYELAYDEVVCYNGLAPLVEMISWKYENEELIIEIQYSELILNDYKDIQNFWNDLHSNGVDIYSTDSFFKNLK